MPISAKPHLLCALYHGYFLLAFSCYSVIYRKYSHSAKNLAKVKGQNHSRLLKMSLPTKLPEGEGTNVVCSHRCDEIDLYERKRGEKGMELEDFIQTAKNTTCFCEFILTFYSSGIKRLQYLRS